MLKNAFNIFFIHGYIRKIGNVLFNDALNISFTVMVKDYSDTERELAAATTLATFICYITDMIAHTAVFVTPVVDHWLE